MARNSSFPPPTESASLSRNIRRFAYDPVKDEVVGILEEYIMKKGIKLVEAKARPLLERAEWIVAHNSTGDQSLLVL